MPSFSVPHYCWLLLSDPSLPYEQGVFPRTANWLQLTRGHLTYPKAGLGWGVSKHFPLKVVSRRVITNFQTFRFFLHCSQSVKLTFKTNCACVSLLVCRCSGCVWSHDWLLITMDIEHDLLRAIGLASLNQVCSTNDCLFIVKVLTVMKH